MIAVSTFAAKPPVVKMTRFGTARTAGRRTGTRRPTGRSRSEPRQPHLIAEADHDGDEGHPDDQRHQCDRADVAEAQHQCDQPTTCPPPEHCPPLGQRPARPEPARHREVQCGGHERAPDDHRHRDREPAAAGGAAIAVAMMAWGCPNTPAGCTVDANGCPVDSDRDGVCDGLDQCANTTAGAPWTRTAARRTATATVVGDRPDQCPNTPTGCPRRRGRLPDRDLGARGGAAGEGLDHGSRHLLRHGQVDDQARVRARRCRSCARSSSSGRRCRSRSADTPTPRLDEYNMALSDQRAAAVLEWLRANCPNANLSNFTAEGLRRVHAGGLEQDRRTA